MKKIENLTPEQESKLKDYREEWVNNYLSGEISSFKDVVDSHKELYRLCKLKDPVVLYAPDPISCQIYANAFFLMLPDHVLNHVRNQVGDQVWSEVWSKVDSQVWTEVYSQAGDQVESQVEDQVGDRVVDRVGDRVVEQVVEQVESQVESQVGDKVGSQVRSQVINQVSDQVRGQVGNLVRSQVRSQVINQVSDQVEGQVGNLVRSQVINQVSANKTYNYSSYINYSDAGWLSFYSFFNNEVLRLDKEKELNSVIYAAKNSFMSIQLDGLCVVSAKPCIVKTNNSNDLHCVDGPAIVFPSGYSQYYVNGRTVDSTLIDNPISKEMIINEVNEDVKAAMITIIKERDGDEALLNTLGAVIVDEKEIEHFTGYTEIVRLYKTREKYVILQDRFGNMNQPYCWSEIKCPSTGSTYLIENSADFTDALEALAWLRPSFDGLIMDDVEYKWPEFAN